MVEEQVDAGFIYGVETAAANIMECGEAVAINVNINDIGGDGIGGDGGDGGDQGDGGDGGDWSIDLFWSIRR